MGLAAQPQLSILSEMVQSFKEGQEVGQQKLQAAPTYIIATNLGSRSLRLAHLSYGLLRNSNPALKDNQPLSSAAKVAIVYLLLESATVAYLGGKELVRRLNNPQDQTGTEESEAALDNDAQSAETIANTLTAVAIGLQVLQTWQGKVLLSRRDLSPYGRAFSLVNAVPPAIKLAYRFSR